MREVWYWYNKRCMSMLCPIFIFIICYYNIMKIEQTKQSLNPKISLICPILDCQVIFVIIRAVGCGPYFPQDAWVDVD